MNTLEARAALGLAGASPTLSRDAIMTAWRLGVIAAHPDSSAVPSAEAAGVIEKLTEARKTLLAAITGADLACKLCKGTGIVRASLGSRTCAACDGTGEKQL